MYQAKDETCLVKKHFNKDLTTNLIIPKTAVFHKHYGSTEICEVVSVSKLSEFNGILAPGDFIICNKGEGIRIESIDNLWIMKDKWIYIKVDKDFVGGSYHEQ